jgi:hypothetical protein
MMSVNKKGVKDDTFSNSNVGGGCTLETEARGQQHLRNMIQYIVFIIYCDPNMGHILSDFFIYKLRLKKDTKDGFSNV